MTQKILEVKNMEFAYGKDPILENVNLNINRGDFVAVIGANGSGKSTLFKTMLNFLTPQKGSIELFGENVQTIKNWKSVGYVPQGGLLQVSNFPATVEEIMLLRLPKPKIFQFYSNDRKASVRDALRHVGIEDKKDMMIQNLSGGQLQRVLIARELMMNPEVIFLDEPTTGLDKKSIDSLFELLKHINEIHGITIIMVTHDKQRSNPLINRTFEVFDRQVKEIHHV